MNVRPIDDRPTTFNHPDHQLQHNRMTNKKPVHQTLLFRSLAVFLAVLLLLWYFFYH